MESSIEAGLKRRADATAAAYQSKNDEVCIRKRILLEHLQASWACLLFDCWEVIVCVEVCESGETILGGVKWGSVCVGVRVRVFSDGVVAGMLSNLS